MSQCLLCLSQIKNRLHFQYVEKWNIARARGGGGGWGVRDAGPSQCLLGILFLL